MSQLSLEFITSLVGKAINHAIQNKIRPALSDMATRINAINSIHRKRIEALEGTWAREKVDELFAKRWEEFETKVIEATNSRDVAKLIKRELTRETTTRYEDFFSGRLQHLENSVDTLWARASASYQGVYTPLVTYPAGSLVNYRSALWHADVDTSASPGAADDGWTLVVKSPRDRDRDRERR